jgi:hypothetical protein
VRGNLADLPYRLEGLGAQLADALCDGIGHGEDRIGLLIEQERIVPEVRPVMRHEGDRLSVAKLTAFGVPVRFSEFPFRASCTPSILSKARR